MKQPAGNDTAAGQVATPLAKSELLVDLPQDTCNTSDGMCLLPDGNVIVSVPNFNDLTQQSALWKITPENKAELFLELPNHPETAKPVGPLGVCVAPSGDLYLADYQMEGNRQSRVLRIVVKDGKPADIVTVASGFAVSNAVIVRDGHLYVTDTQVDTTVRPAISGVFRFKLGEEGVDLKTLPMDDPHLIATITCHDAELPLGADGLAFDKQGNLYVSNFADGTVHKLTFEEQGKVATNQIFAKAEFMKCADGLFFDPVKERIYVADSRANAVHAVALDGSVSILAQNRDTDGTDGGMDQPCEVLLRGRELIVSNMDWPVAGCVNQRYDKPCVITAIRLD
ncbi:MAG: hypothetical protein A2V70_04095 [Planctomycetes bacterium RBG_13_63_9]|nr:MAG: hypothetical protein A2V70_04095 [Planctomycetes bacterium RBG_13_63_9]